MDRWGRRGALIALVVLVAANVAFWGISYHRQGQRSASFSRLTPSVSPSSAAPSSAATKPSAPAQATAIPLPDTSGREFKVSVVGDSLGTGRYASSPNTRFRGLMVAALQVKGVVGVQEAVRTSGPLSADVAVPNGLDLVVLELGTDDLAKTDVNGFEAVYGPLVKSVRLGSPRAALVCAGTWSSSSQASQAFDNVIKQDCEREQGHFVSLRSLYDTAANRGPAGVAGFYGVSDDVAPNDAGHRAIAAALLSPVNVSLS